MQVRHGADLVIMTFQQRGIKMIKIANGIMLKESTISPNTGRSVYEGLDETNKQRTAAGKQPLSKAYWAYHGHGIGKPVPKMASSIPSYMDPMQRYDTNARNPFSSGPLGSLVSKLTGRAKSKQQQGGLAGLMPKPKTTVPTTQQPSFQQNI